jgi:hypothetical protein
MRRRIKLVVRPSSAPSLVSLMIGAVSVWLCAFGAGLLCAGSVWAAGPPTVEGGSLTKVTATSATLHAVVNTEEASTEYHFEYGRCASLANCAASAYEASIPSPDATLAAGVEAEEVSAPVQDLVPASAYHVRLVARNASGVSDGEEVRFSTQTPNAGGLPDERSWEMVSPPHKEGARLGWISEGILQAAANGDAIVDAASEPIEFAAPSSAADVDVYFGRGADGWVSRTIAPPQSSDTGTPVGEGTAYRFFSEDLSKGIVQPFGSFAKLSPQSTESTAYLHTSYLDGDPGDICTSECFTPLVSAANVPAGTVFGEEPNGACEHSQCGPFFVGANPELTAAALNSRAQLTSTPLEGHAGHYEWRDGRLQLVNVLPAGELFEGEGPIAEPEFTGNLNDRVSRGEISGDGSRVAWLGQTQNRGSAHLYVRDMTSGASTRLDLSNTGVAPNEERNDAVYALANGDLSRVLFLDGERLTADSTAAGSGGTSLQTDLYEYDFAAPAGARLTDLTPDANAGQSAEVSNVIGANEDDSYVYFTASGALAPGAQAGHCNVNFGETSEPCNLYVRHDGTTKLIAALTPDDFSDWATALPRTTARVSPNGLWLAFDSSGHPTGYDNADAVSGQPDEEVYLYDAATEKLTCASCDPSGARPAGAETGHEATLSGGAGNIFEPATWVAANVPPWTPMALGQAEYQSRYLSNSGRLFFDSHDALSPQDVNGTEDVYELEPTGVGSCTATGASFSERSGGCVALISSGTSTEESAFLDASETGSNVFFLTAAKLSSADFDNQLDIYDARECTGSSSCFAPAPVQPSPCETGDSCKPAPSPQPTIFGAPASSTFVGVGNVSPPASKPAATKRSATKTVKCKKRFARSKKGRCVRKSKSKKKAKKSAKPNGRTSR